MSLIDTTLDAGRQEERSLTGAANVLANLPHEWIGAPYHADDNNGALLHDLFEHQADARPAAVALQCGDKLLTYCELDKRANQLARHLRQHGIGVGCCVGMLLPRGIDVYVALLGVLKAGAAYVPLDPEYPTDRVTYILTDCQCRVVVTNSELAARHGLSGQQALLMDQQWDQVAKESGERLPAEEIDVRPTDLCYVIYTSGSTGKPKGVQIEHRSAANLVRAEGAIFAITSGDLVYQGFSIAFDASVEEVWLAFFAGARLVVGTWEMAHAGPALSAMLTQAGVTVLSCVPTLLSMMVDDVPTLRLLIVGGEQCQADLVQRWATPGRRMVNTYGPTEATVIATYGDCHPGQPVTIGRPVSGYRIYILDPQMIPLPAGEVGELHIGGVGLSRGYVGRPDLTAEKFVADPFGPPGHRLYKSGDLARYNENGQIEFMGRADSQVKIRGFRVELSEIESTLMRCPGVQQAAVAVRQDIPGVQQLVGYIVSRDGRPADEETIKAHLRTGLPAYMVPALLEMVNELPQLPSGKVDRKRLPAPRARSAPAGLAADGPRTDWERKVGVVWERLFAPAVVGREADFFTDLGGHSLLAARMVSELRRVDGFQELSVLDIYNYPTVAQLAGAFETRSAVAKPVQPQPDSCKKDKHPRLSPHWAGLGQLFGLYGVMLLMSLNWLAPFFMYEHAAGQGHTMRVAMAAALGLTLALNPLMLAVAIAAKWLIIGRYRAGSYPLWGWYYLRWWLVQRVLAMAPTHSLIGTPLLNAYLRLMGARIGKSVFIGTDHIGNFDLLHIGDGSSIGLETSLLGYSIEDARLRIGSIKMGKKAFVGARSALRIGSVMGDGASLAELSLLPERERIPPGEKWMGSPARPLALHNGVNHPVLKSIGVPAAIGPMVTALHALGWLLLPAVSLMATLPGLILLSFVVQRFGGYWFLAASPLVAVLYILCLALEIAWFKWVLLGQVAPDSYPLNSYFYVRKWFVDQLMDTSLTVLGPMYSTLYLGPWYRLLGVKLGANSEVSTAHTITPDLLSIGQGSFIADSVSLGAARIHDGMTTLSRTQIGQRAFIGNSAMVPGGSTIGDRCLIGVMSTPPQTVGQTTAQGTSWLGSPAIFLPQRQASKAFPEQTTYQPTRAKVLQRLSIEFFRVTLPLTLVVLLSGILFSAIVALNGHLNHRELIALFPLLYLGCGMAAALVVIVAKWVLMGRYRPGEHPLWSTFVWRTELLTAMHEHLADPFLVRMLLGTPFVPWFFRLLGCTIGKRVYMETTSLTEFDLIHIGDDVALNQDCTIQTHLFEDRVMKMSHIKIGDHCWAGTRSVVLYDSFMHDGSAISDLSLVMKGESLPTNTVWEGTPARRAPRRALSKTDEIRTTGQGATVWPVLGQRLADAMIPVVAKTATCQA